MRTLPKTLRRLCLAIGLVLTAGAPIFACGSGGAGSPAEIDFHQTSELLPGLDFDTGLLPSGSPVQASFSITAHGDATIDAAAAVSGSLSAPTLTGLPKRGTIAIDGDFALDGKLKIDVSGLPSYDGPIPGIENVKIAIKSTTEFDPFSIHHGVKARADIPKAKLPSIPLPGGIPGDLALEVVEGSFVELTFTGTCAGAADKEATYEGSIARAGTLVIQPTIEIKVPIVGTKSYPIPKFTVNLALGSSDVEMEAKVTSVGDKPSSGDSVTGTCKSTSGGGGGDTGNGGHGGSGGEKDGGTGGICNSGYSIDDKTVVACINKSCCDEFATCTMNGSDIQGCVDCVNNGGGARCQTFYACIQPCEGAICDSGEAVTDDAPLAVCLSTNCCAQFEACTANGTNVQACQDCFTANGGALCDDALNCADTSCGAGAGGAGGGN